jgi:hypothetical protein
MSPLRKGFGVADPAAKDHKPHIVSNLHHVSTLPQTPDSSPISPSVAVPSSQHFSGMRHSRTRSALLSASPTFYHGPSSSVSALGFESGLAQIRVDEGTHSSSSSEDELGYESDDRMSIGSTSRRGSASFDRRKDAIEPATIRQFSSSGKSLRPKVKSFLRISKDLQEEMSPLDFEIRREAEVTLTLRDEDHPTSKNGEAKSPFEQENNASLSVTQSRTEALLSRFQGMQEHDSELTTPAKRKAAIFEETTAMKRRAVSPGMGSPVIGSPAMGSPIIGSPVLGSPTSNIGKRTSIKQLSDTSDGLENMRL